MKETRRLELEGRKARGRTAGKEPPINRATAKIITKILATIAIRTGTTMATKTAARMVAETATARTTGRATTPTTRTRTVPTTAAATTTKKKSNPKTDTNVEKYIKIFVFANLSHTEIN